MGRIQIGIDFGSTYTYVYMMETGSNSLQRVGEQVLYENQAGIPTKIGKYTDSDGSLRTSIGMIAQYRFLNDKLTRASQHTFERRNLKRSLREEYSLENPTGEQERQFQTDKEDITEFFRQIFHGTDENFRGRIDEVEKIVFGCPAPTPEDAGDESEDQGVTDELSYSAQLKEILQEIFPNLSSDAIIPYPEPVLAGFAIIRSQLSEGPFPDGTYLFVDLGGSTNDYTVLSVKGGELENNKPLYHSTQGGMGPSGAWYDSKMTDAVPGLTKYMAQRAKEKIFASAKRDPTFDDVGNAMAEMPDGHQKQVKFRYKREPGRIEPPEDQDCICCYLCDDCEFEKLYDQTARRAARVVETAFEANPEIVLDRVYFVGGSARMRPLRKRIMDKIKETCGDKLRDGSCDYIGEYGDSADAVTGQEREPLTCSNIVAYGAVLMAHEGIVIAPDPLEGIRCAFGSKNENIIFKVSTEPLSGQLTGKPEHQIAYFGVKHESTSDERDEKGRRTIKISVSNTQKPKNNQKPVTVSYKRRPQSIPFWIIARHGGDDFRYPKHGTYQFPISGLEFVGNQKNILRIFLLYTVERDFYVLLLPNAKKGLSEYPKNYSDTELVDNIDLKNARIYSLQMDTPENGEGGRKFTSNAKNNSDEMKLIKEFIDKCGTKK